MIDVQIPKGGMSTVEVEIIVVHIQPGSHVNIGDPLVNIETEKVDVVVESEHTGTVREVLVSEGQECEVGDVICRIEPDPA